MVVKQLLYTVLLSLNPSYGTQENAKETRAANWWLYKELHLVEYFFYKLNRLPFSKINKHILSKLLQRIYAYSILFISEIIWCTLL